MFKAFILTLVGYIFFISSPVLAQKKDIKKNNAHIFTKSDISKKYSPRIATYRSAILPGWGQATNKKYWKNQIVYGALGTTAYIFRNNVKQYKAAKNAYTNSADGNPANDYLIPQPYYSVKDQPDRIKSFRNQVRQNVDYTVLFFILFWGLNVMDATVDAHLKTFDVSDNLTLQIKPGYSPLANTKGISIALNFGKNHTK